LSPVGQPATGFGGAHEETHIGVRSRVGGIVKEWGNEVQAVYPPCRRNNPPGCTPGSEETPPCESIPFAHRNRQPSSGSTWTSSSASRSRASSRSCSTR